MAEVAPDTMVDGRYRVLNRLGAGGMADVYCAEDTHLGRQVALKVLYRRFAAGRGVRRAVQARGAVGRRPDAPERRQRLRPRRARRHLLHRDGVPAGAHAEGGHRRAAARSTRSRVIDIGIQILRAASFAHRRGVIHRDLKPHNVMLDDAGNAKVTDFGIARAGASEMTEAGSIMGTAQYLSPEQAQGQPATAQSDLYSVGIILYELLTGRLPFDGESAVAIAVQHLNDPPPPIRSLRPDVAPELEAAVMRALAKDPAARWADADEFIRALEGARAGRSPRRRSGRTRPRSRRSSRPPTAGGGARGGAQAALAVDRARAHGAAARARGAPARGRGQGRGRATWSASPRPSRWTGLQDDGFEVDVDRQPDLAPVGEVIHQDPAGGTEADEGSTVNLVVSTGPGEVTVPTVAGFTEKRAVRELNERRLRPARGHEPVRLQGRGAPRGVRPDRRGRRDQDEPAGRHAAPRWARASCCSSRPARSRSRSRT